MGKILEQFSIAKDLNSDIPWKYLYGWVAAVLLWVIWYGFATNGGDITYGRLDAKWYADVQVDWYIVIFPLILVFLTRFRGIPVSTSLLILSIFASELLFQKIVMKSALWYLVAFIASFFMWTIVEVTLKKAASQAKNKAFNFVEIIYVLEDSSDIYYCSSFLYMAHARYGKYCCISLTNTQCQYHGTYFIYFLTWTCLYFPYKRMTSMKHSYQKDIDQWDCSSNDDRSRILCHPSYIQRMV